MKLRSKIAVSAALLGALTTVNAESITFGVSISPIASLSVRDGMLKDVTSMYKAAPVTVVTGETVGGFTVITNMPKWNIYFGFANGGALKNQAGSQLRDDANALVYLGNQPSAVASAAGQAIVFLKTSDAVKANDGTNGVAATLATAVTAPIVNNLSNNTFVKAINDAALTGSCGGAACAFATPWILATDITTANFDIVTGISDDDGAFGTGATKLASVAGTYTETMYLTLVSTY